MSEKTIWVIFWVIVVVLLVASVILAIISYNSPVPEDGSVMSEAIKMFLLCLGGSGVILSTYFSGANMYLQRKFSITENTFYLLSRWDDPHYLEARKFTRQTKDEKADISDNELVRKIKDDGNLRQSVILVLNYLEHVRFSIQTQRIDKQLLQHALGETLVDIAKRFMPYAKTLTPQTISDLEWLIKELQPAKN